MDSADRQEPSKDDGVRKWVAKYMKDGIKVVPVPPKSKVPVIEKWPELRLGPDDIFGYWDVGDNVGILLGEPSEGLVDVDCDLEEAVRVAPHLLPGTLKSGHGPSADEHYLYYADPVPKTAKFRLPSKAGGGGKMVVELRSTGAQTLAPPSTHPNGEKYRWNTSNSDASGRKSAPHVRRVSGDELKRGVEDVAVAALLLRYWPDEGSRHEYVMAATGYLGRRFGRERTERILGAAIAESGDEEARDRSRDVEDTLAGLSDGKHVTGGTTLKKMAPDVADALVAWGVTGPTEGDGRDVTGSTTSKKLRFTTAKEVGRRAPEEVPWLCRGFVAKGTITEIDGKIKSAGKTTFVSHMVASVLAGGRFIDEPTRKAKVLYLTEQNSISFRKVLERAGLTDSEDLHLLYSTETLGRKWAEVAREATDHAIANGCEMLVVDTVGQFAGIQGDGENNAGEAHKAMKPLQEATSEGLAVLVTRHERKSGGAVGDSARGSSAFGGAVDIIFSIRRMEGNGKSSLRVLESLSRLDETPEKIVVELTAEGYRSHGDETNFAEKEAAEAILEILPAERDGGLAQKDVGSKLKDDDFKPTTIHKALKRLREEGRIDRSGKGGKGDPYRYHRTRGPEDYTPVA